MRLIFRGAFWLAFYLFLILFPLVIAALSDPVHGARPFLVEVAAACGYVGLSLMAFQFALVSRNMSIADTFGLDALIQYHREIGIVVGLLILIHPVLLFFNHYFPLDWVFNPLGSKPWEIRWGILAFYSLFFIIVLSIFRKPLHLSYEGWEITHRLLALFTIGAALIHTFTIGVYAGTSAMKIIWALYTLFLGGIAIRYRLVRPLQIWRRPWETVRIIPEHGQSHTLVLRPLGHPGLSFEPGQFAWLITGSSPFATERHPISFSSNGDVPSGGEVSLTIKNLGNWSGSVVPRMIPGKRVWLDGPYGVFSVDREEGPGYVLIGGGVGITPLRSMIVTLVARGDVRPVLLFYGAKSWDSLTFREELDSLSNRIKNFKVIYVLEQPPVGWKGETGFITAELLQRHLPDPYKRLQYFICGPGALMDVMEKILPSIGVPADRIHTERFEMV